MKDKNKIVELMVIRLNEEGQIDIIYSDVLVNLMNSNPTDEVKKAIIDSTNSVIENINKELVKLKEQKENDNNN